MKQKDIRTYAVILAGGEGKRMGGVYKQFSYINGYPILFYSIDIFTKCKFINRVIVVVPKNKIKYARGLISKKYNQNNIDVIAGAKTRRGSSSNAINYIITEKMGCDYVIFHDGVRPLINIKMVEEVLSEAKKYGAAVLGSSVLNVIVSLKNKIITEVFNANSVYNTQTPHCYRFDIIKKAHENNGNEILENIELVCSLGGKIKLVDKFYRNMKLTFPQDIAPLSSLLKKTNTGNFFDLVE